MSLVDIDSGSLDRGAPRPNHPDRLDEGAVKAHQTLSTTYKTDASVANVRIRYLNSVILYYDDQNRVIRVDGFIPSLAAYPVTIIAQYGYDVYVDILGLTAP